MSARNRALLAFGLLTCVALCASFARAADDALPKSEAVGSHGAVAAGGAEAVAIGIEMLKHGGNAADAAAATILALSVTDSRGFCFGGEVPIIVYDARRKVVEVLSGQGAALPWPRANILPAREASPVRGSKRPPFPPRLTRASPCSIAMAQSGWPMRPRARLFCSIGKKRTGTRCWAAHAAPLDCRRKTGGCRS